jgi:transcriptional regulator with XRE-family HTH domain
VNITFNVNRFEVNLLEIFCERLKASRSASKLKLEDIERELGISKRAYLYYESGDREPNLEKQKALCDLFNVSADYLLGLTDDPGRH